MDERLLAFDQDLYVERMGIKSDIRRWLNGPASQRWPLYSLKGSPGVGKTWLMKKILEQEEEDGRLTVWLDARKWLKDKNIWLVRLVQELNAKHSLSIVANIDAPESTIESIRVAICTCCPNPPPLVLADELDTLLKKDAEIFEESVLRRFYNGDDCIRMIVAYRNRLHNDFLRYDCDYESDDKPDVVIFEDQESCLAVKQFKKLQRKYKLSPEDICNSMFPGRNEYQWNHPYINTCLFHRLRNRVEGISGDENTIQDIQECCLELINRPSSASSTGRSPLIGKDECEVLVKLAVDLPEVWTDAALRQYGYKMSELDKHLQQGVIRHVPDIYHEIAPGLRDTLRDLDAWREKENSNE